MWSVCVSVCVLVSVWEVINIESQRVPFWFVCDVFAWSLRVQLWPTGFWTHQLFSSLLLRLQAGDEYWSLDAAHWSLGTLVAPLKGFSRHLSALSSCGWEKERERAHYVLFVGKQSPLNFVCYVLSLTSVVFCSTLESHLIIQKSHINNRWFWFISMAVKSSFSMFCL